MNVIVKRLLLAGVAAAGMATMPMGTAAYAQTAVRTYSIPAENLGDALREFAAQSGRDVVFDPTLTAGKNNRAIQGTSDAEQALRTMLAGSGLSYVTTSTGFAIRGNGAAADKAAEGEAAQQAIVVTGTHIHGAGAAGVSPVIQLTRKDLDRTGRATLADTLAQLPQNFASPTQGFNGVAQMINLRGLGADNTLVLVDGHRIANSGASDALQITGVDLDSIPLAAVDRVEVLPDGASAIYGADAVGGVVNIILKKDFTGSQITAEGGESQEGGARELNSSLTTGWSGHRINFLLTGEYFQRDALAARDRSFSRSDDRRPSGGRDDRLPFSNPGNVLSLNGQNLPGLDAPFAGIPAGQDGRNLTPADFVATAGRLNLESDFGNFADLVPKSKRYAFDARVNWQLSARVTAWAEGALSHNELQAGTIPPTFFAIVPATNPFNPFGTPVAVEWLGTELGPAVVASRTSDQRFATGVDGRLGGSWNWQGSVGYSRDTFHQSLPLSIFGPILNDLLGSTDPATALNVFGDNGGNSPAVLNRLGFGRFLGTGRSSLWTANGAADGPLFTWSGRTLKAALGWEFRRENFDATSVEFQIDPQIPNFDRTTQGDRKVFAAFAELDQPLFTPQHRAPGVYDLELQLAARYEHYSDFGDIINPKIAMRWRPVAKLAFRASYGTSFRAPQLRELFQVSTPLGEVVFDPRRNESVLASVLIGGNRNLKPEKSRTWNLGVVWDLPFVADLSLTADVWRLKQRQRISNLSAAELLAAESFFPDRVTRAAPTPADIAAGLPGQVLSVDTTSLNASSAELRGLDIGVKYERRTAAGTFDVALNGAHIFSAKRQLTPVAPVEQLAGVLSGALTGEETADRPEVKTRANIQFFWSRNGWEAGATEHYISSAHDPFSVLHPKVASQYMTDLQLSHVWEKRSGWLSGAKASLTILNVFNRKPPFADEIFGFASSISDPRGAFYELRLTKAF